MTTRLETRLPLPEWAPALFRSELELRSSPELRVVGIRGDATSATVSEQFQGGAETYHARYAASAVFERLFRQAIDAAGLDLGPAPAILDLGSGSGVNSVVPCLGLFPQARIVATDLSADMLAILARHLAGSPDAERVVCVVMDAMAAHTEPGAFDLVTGASILHHLTRPEAGLAAASRALRPGGHAIFFEPFDGYGVMRLAYERILAESKTQPWPLDPAVEGAFRAMATDIAARTEPDPESAQFHALDDKWLFSRERIERAAAEAGFARAQVIAHNDHKDLYRKLALVQVRLSTGRDDLPIPEWALAILDSFDAALPPAVKRLLPTEGTIVLTK